MKGKHLSRHRNNLYFRRRVPKDLKHWFSGNEIKRSLKSKSFNGCKTLLHQWDAQLESVFIKIRATVFKPEEVKAIIDMTPLFREMAEPPLRADFFVSVPPREPSKEPPKDPIGGLCKQYIREQEISERWTAKTKTEVEGMFRLFVEVVGDVPVIGITHQKLLSFRDTLVRLPANHRKSPRFRGKTIPEILKIGNLIPMSLTRVNIILSWVGSFFKWCQKHGFVKEVFGSGLTLPRKARKHEERAIYTEADIEKMLKSPVFSAVETSRADYFWVPLIALFSGMRLNEICQLYTEDIKKVDEIWCFDVNSEKDKILKNLSSKRLVPVHPTLIDIGFLEYVEKMRKAGCPRLWMALKLRRDGYGHTFSNFWQRYNRKFITADPKKVFHSFRHTLANTLKQKGSNDSVIAEILGHAINSITLGRYGKKYQPSVLLEELKKITYQVDVERLKGIAKAFHASFIG